MTRRRGWGGIIAGVLLFGRSSMAQLPSSEPDSARLVTEDIPRFWYAFDARGALGSTQAFDSLYLRPGTEGLRDFTRMRIRSAALLATAVDLHEAYYRSARASTLGIDSLAPPIRESFRTLKRLYPDAVFPNVYFVIGRLSTAGTVSNSGLLIGVELLSRSDERAVATLDPWQRFVVRPASDIPAVVAHELVHYQQRIVGRTLLATSLREGSADFLAELLTGHPLNVALRQWALPREHELWTAFTTQMDSTNLAGWFERSDVADRPADLGYFIGSQIARAYYARSADKARAVREMLVMPDPSAFLRESGYAGGH